MTRAPRWVLLASLACSGCFSWNDNTWPESSRAGAMPSINSLAIPEWPPLGPDSTITVSATSGEPLQRMCFYFEKSYCAPLEGKSASVTMPAAGLGQGFGDLTITVWDVRQRTASRHTTNVLIDLGAPKLQVSRTTLRAKNDVLEVSVADAWVLGSVELTAGGKSQLHEFAAGYPEGTGKSWDYSLVEFPTTLIPPGYGFVTLKVADAAGNVHAEDVEVLVDAHAPQVSFASPAPGSTVSGPFEVTIDATDQEEPSVTLELSLAGMLVAKALGPKATVSLLSDDYPTGPITLEATARDEAGNASTAQLSLTLK